MLNTINTLSVYNGNNDEEEEDMRCFFCHETAFHIPALAAYRLCGCPASPLICAYCCLSKDKCFCSECGAKFDKQVLREKGQYLKKMQIKAAKQSQQALNVSQHSAFFPGSSGVFQQQCQGMQGQLREMQVQQASLQQSQQQQSQSQMNNFPMSWTNRGNSNIFNQQGQHNLAESLSFSGIEERNIDQDLVMEAYSINSESSGDYSQQSQQNMKQCGISRSQTVKKGNPYQQNTQSSSACNSSSSTASTLLHSSSLFGSLQIQPINNVNLCNNNNTNSRFINAQQAQQEQQQQLQQQQQYAQQQGYLINQQQPGMVPQQYGQDSGARQIQFSQQPSQISLQGQQIQQSNQFPQIFQQNNNNNYNNNNNNSQNIFSSNHSQTISPFVQQQERQQQQVFEYQQTGISNQYNNNNQHQQQYYQNERFNDSNSQTMRLQDSHLIQQNQQQQNQQSFIPQTATYQSNTFAFPCNLQQNQQQIFSDIQQRIFNQQQQQQQQQQQIPQQFDQFQVQHNNQNQDLSGMIVEHEQPLNSFNPADQSQVMYQQQLEEQQQLFSEFTLNDHQQGQQNQQQDVRQQQQQQQSILPNELQQQTHQRGRTTQQQQYSQLCSSLQNVDSRGSSHSRTQGTLVVLGNSSRLPQHQFGCSSNMFQSNPIGINQLAKQRSASFSSEKHENPINGSIIDTNNQQLQQSEKVLANKALAQQFKQLRYSPRSVSCDPTKQMLASGIEQQQPQQIQQQQIIQQQLNNFNIQEQSPLGSVSQRQQLQQSPARSQQLQATPQQNKQKTSLFQSDSLHYNNNNNNKNTQISSFNNTNNSNLFSSSSLFQNIH